MKTKNLKQTANFKCTCKEVYDLLMDSKEHGALTGGKASISKKVGGKFSVFDGYAIGKNLELIQDKKIVQTWNASDWDKEAQESIITFSLTKTKSGCKLTFTHQGIPAEHFDGIKQGWKDYYWTPMKKMLEK